MYHEYTPDCRAYPLVPFRIINLFRSESEGDDKMILASNTKYF